MAAITLPTDPVLALSTFQAILDSNPGTVTLPNGLTEFVATPANRFLRIDKPVILRTNERSILKLGPDTLGGPGFDSANYAWRLFQIMNVPGLSVEFGPGITLQAPNVNPSVFPSNTVAPPTAVWVEGLSAADAHRVIKWAEPVIRGPWRDGIVLADVTDRSTNQNRTEVWLTNADIETKGGGLSVFGRNKSLHVNGIRMVCGHYYPNGEPFGNGGYSHQDNEIDIANGEITSTGRGCWKDAGTNAVGGRPGAFTNLVFRSLKQGYGAGLSLDTFADRVVSGCRFDSSLYVGVQVYGKAQTVNNIFNCAIAFGGAGDLSGGSPVILSTADRFIGVSQVWSLGMAGAHVKFVDSTVIPGANATPFSLPDNNLTRTMTVDVIRPVVNGDVRSVCDMQGGRWNVEGLIHKGAASIGVFSQGMRSGSAVVRGGSWQGPEFHHSTTPEAKARVQFIP